MAQVLFKIGRLQLTSSMSVFHAMTQPFPTPRVRLTPVQANIYQYFLLARMKAPLPNMSQAYQLPDLKCLQIRLQFPVRPLKMLKDSQ